MPIASRTRSATKYTASQTIARVSTTTSKTQIRLSDQPPQIQAQSTQTHDRPMAAALTARPNSRRSVPVQGMMARAGIKRRRPEPEDSDESPISEPPR